MPGKVSPEDLLTQVFGRTGAADETLLQGPAYGEDAAAIDPPAGTLVVSSDPISLAASQIGTLGVYVACNDVAVSGADPRWLTVVLMLPDEDLLETVTEDVDVAAREVGATVVGGHSEYVDALERPLVCLTAMGVAEEYVPTGGANPGDRLVLTKAAGLEGAAVLAADFGDDLEVAADVCERAEGFLEEVSVVPDARVLREYATAMHDPTEGGVAAGLYELAQASGVCLEVSREAIPVRKETRTLCDAAEVDPLRIFGSGSVVAAVPEAEVEEALEALADAGLEGAEIGRVCEGEPELRIDDEVIAEPVEDDLYPLWEAADAEE